MKLFNRFALLAIVASIFGSALVMGCGGSTPDEDTNTANGNAMASPSASADADTTP